MNCVKFLQTEYQAAVASGSLLIYFCSLQIFNKSLLLSNLFKTEPRILRVTE
jgi:hypothetical protein